MAPGCKPGGLTSYVGSNPTPCILSGDDTGAGVGIEPVDGAELRPGRHLRGAGKTSGSEGYITSGVYSGTLQRWVGMAMVRGGHGRQGEILDIVTGGRALKVRIAPLCAYDPQGARLRE